MKNHYILFFLLLSFLPSMSAQPGQSYLGGEGNDYLAHVRVLPDGNLLAVGAKSVGGQSRVWLLKMTPDRAVIWERTYPNPTPGTHRYGYGMYPAPDGAILIVGKQCGGSSYSASNLGVCIKTDSEGNEAWSYSYSQATALFDVVPRGNNFLLVGSGPSNRGSLIHINGNGGFLWRIPVDVDYYTKALKIIATPDGNFLILGRANTIGVGFQGVFMWKVNPNGGTIWRNTYDTDWSEYFPSACGYNYLPFGARLLPDGRIWVAHPFGHASGIGVFKFSAHGHLQEQKKYGSANLWEQPGGLIALSNGDLLVTGEQRFGWGNASRGLAARISPEGIELWRRAYGHSSHSGKIHGAVQLADSTFFMVGSIRSPDGNGGFDGWALRAEQDGSAYPYKIEGRAVFDLNNNCQADPGEPPAKGWFVQTIHPDFPMFVTDADGRFSLPTEQMVNQFVLLPSVGNWTLCNPDLTLFVHEENPTSSFTFLIQSADGGCADTELGITQPDLMRCEQSNFAVTVQNRGLGESGHLLLTLTLDPALSIVSASEPYLANSRTVEFAIPPMNGLEQKNIQVKVLTACDVQLGATHGVVARLAPLECELPWAGARFAVEGECDAAQFVFR
jgi:hypothetical protein